MRGRGGEESEGVARGSAEESDQRVYLASTGSLSSLSAILAAVDVRVDVDVGDVPVQH